MTRNPTLLLFSVALTAPVLGQDFTEGLLSGPSTFASDSWSDSERPDDRPPPGVEYADRLGVGRFEFSWQWTGDLGDGVRQGQRNVRSEDVFAAGFDASPRNWRRNEHRFGFYYGAGESTTLSLLVPLVDTEIKFETPDGGTYRDRASGLGDVEVAMHRTLRADDGASLSAGARVTLPIGSVDEEASNPFSGGLDQRQPYFLQPGGGTFGLEPSLTWRRWSDIWSWGAQVAYDAHFGENGEDWSRGDVMDIDLWVAQRLTRDHSLSVRVHGVRWDGIDGRDPAIVQSISPVHVASSSGGTSVDLFAGVNIVGIEGHRFAFEIGGPVYQDLDGLQVERDISYRLGWRYSF